MVFHGIVPLVAGIIKLFVAISIHLLYSFSKKGAVMNREERNERDDKIITRYKAGGSVENIARDCGISVAGVYAITRKNNVARWTSRGPKKIKEMPESMKLEPEAYLLVARKATKSLAAAQLWLTRAAFLDKYPGTTLVTHKDVGISKTKVLAAVRELFKIDATLCTVAPFKILFTTGNKYLEMTHKQYIVFLAHPFFYILEHRDEVKTLC